MRWQAVRRNDGAEINQPGPVCSEVRRDLEDCRVMGQSRTRHDAVEWAASIGCGEACSDWHGRHDGAGPQPRLTRAQSTSEPRQVKRVAATATAARLISPLLTWLCLVPFPSQFGSAAMCERIDPGEYGSSSCCVCLLEPADLVDVASLPRRQQLTNEPLIMRQPARSLNFHRVRT